MAKIGWTQVLTFRLRRQRLDERRGGGAMLDVARDLCGLHAQLTSSAELTLQARLDGLEPGAMQRALWQERTLVKTWAMRGTLHLFAADDYPLWPAALPAFYRVQPAWLRHYGLTADELERLLDAIEDALGGEPLTRGQLAEAVTASTGSAHLGEQMRHSWGALLKPAAFQGRLCFGPSKGQNVTFTRPDRWLGRPIRRSDPREAMREVARRYLDAFGPARVEDLGRWWAGISAAQASRLLASLGDEVANVEVDGATLWLLRAHLDQLRSAQSSRLVRLLPAFDQYVVGAPRAEDAVLAPALRKRVYRDQGWLSPVLVVDGRMEGVWHHQRKGSRVLVAIEPFGDLPAWVKPAAELEAERLAVYLGGKAEVAWATTSAP